MKKSFMTRMLAVSLSAAMTFSLSSASSLTATEAAAKKLPANNKAVSISLKVGNSKVLKLKNYKAWNIKKGATNKKAVAAVANKGTAAKRTIKVTAKKAGTAKVTLTLGKRKTADSKTTKYSKTIKKVVTVKVKAADTSTDTTTPTDTTPTDTTPTTPSTTTGSATNVTPGVLHIAQAKATHSDVIAVSFSSIVTSTSAVKVTVTKGTATVDVKNQKWDTNGTGLTLEMVSKLTKGTYTVTATDGKDTTTATVEVTDNEVVDKIVFKGETALTGRENTTDSVGTEAYVYFDVLNQYGDSIKETVSIQWTASASIKSIDRARGKITLNKSKTTDSNGRREAFAYGDKIYVTGVYTKTGLAESGTFSVGTEQSVNKVKLIGFAKKGGSEIISTLPSDFKANEYHLLYEAYDQNDNPMAPNDYIYEDNSSSASSKQLTFISDNVLVVKEVLHNDEHTVTIGGTEYCAANIVPGINVNAGGDLHITAIATKTGTKSEFSVVVGKYKILHKFEMSLPDGVVADGESIEIPFVAEDADQNKITNFRELATQSNFSKLTFNESDGYLALEERDNGDARLVWYDYKIQDGNVTPTADAQWNQSSANGIDRPVSLTSIVVGGETSNLLLQVSDKARPESISKVNIDPVMTNQSVQKISYGNMEFVDQYSRNMKQIYDNARKNDLWVYEYFDGVSVRKANDFQDWNEKYNYDNGFFEASADGVIGGSDDYSSTYKYGVQISMHNAKDSLMGALDETSPRNWNGSKTNLIDLAHPTNSTIYSDLASKTTSETSFVQIDNEPLGYMTNEDDAKTPEDVTLKFSIVKYNEKETNASNKVQEVSKKYTQSFKVVPIENLTNYRIEDLPKIEIETPASKYDNGYEFVEKTVSNRETNLDVTLEENGDAATVKNPKDVKVFASYSGNNVEIPTYNFYVRDGGILNTNGVYRGYRNLNTVDTSKIKYSDLYNTSSARLDRKDVSDTIIADVLKPNDDVQQTVKTVVAISDAKPSVSKFNAKNTIVLPSAKTVIKPRELMESMTSELAYQSDNNKLEIKDQYDQNILSINAWEKKWDSDYDFNPNDMRVTPLDFEYNIKDIVENPNGFVNGNFKINSNSTDDAEITGAEPGDTFTLEITVFAKTQADLVNPSKAKNYNLTKGGFTTKEAAYAYVQANLGYTAADIDAHKGEYDKNTVDDLANIGDAQVVYTVTGYTEKENGIDVGYYRVNAGLNGKAIRRLALLDDTSVTHSVKVTVGADDLCYIHDSDNWYSDEKGEKDADGNYGPSSTTRTVREELQKQLNEVYGIEGYQK